MPSPEAAQVFTMNQELLAAWSADPNASIDDWRRIFEEFLSQIRIPDGVSYTEVDAGGVSAIWATASGAAEDQVVIHFHSGGLVMGSAHGYRAFGGYLSQATGTRVLLVDYRLAPEHAAPAQLEDALSVYDWVLAQGISSSNVVISGDSGGGGLALVLLQQLRERGGEQPACGISLSPMADFTLSGESLVTNAANDPLVPGAALLEPLMAMVLGESGIAKDDPRINCLYGNWQGVPPLLIMAGSIEALRDDGKRAVEGAEKAGVDATWVEGEGMVHIWPTFADRLPEARDALEQIGAFTRKHIGVHAAA